MKKIITLIFIFALMSFGKCYAQSQFSPVLSKMEKSLFGVDYSTQNDSDRLNRIEESVYGKTSANSMQQRVDKLSKDLVADVIGQEIKGKRDTFEDEQDSFKEPIPKADSSVNYPIVNNLEQSVFNKEFKNVEINQRLSALEQKVFKKTYNDDLNARVNRLKVAVMPRQNAFNNDSEDEDDYSDSDILSDNLPQNLLSKNPSQTTFDDDDSEPAYNSNNSVLDSYNSNPDVTIPLAALEKSILKKAYPNDIVQNRLTRLEVKMFGTNFVDDDEQTRIDRISSANQAKKTSSRYDNNKFSQHAATAMQVGALILMVLAAIL